MPIHYSAERMNEVKQRWSAWWAGDIDRPMLHLTGYGEPDRAPSKYEFKHFTAHYPMHMDADDVMDSWDYQLSCLRWYADAYPSMFVNFGPGVVAAFLGARVSVSSDTVWFHPEHPVELAALKLTYDRHNLWYRRVHQLTQAAREWFGDQLVVSMTDLGGNLDILHSFRPGTDLLYDLVDDPDSVKRLTWEAHELWWRYYDELSAVAQCERQGYTAWTPLWSAEPYYMLQCDFCYMLGPDMFCEFVLPELQATCRRLKHAFYHLDGAGQLPHVDTLLDIDELKGIQWVPGSNSPGVTHWPELYRRFRERGKLVQLFCSPEEALALTELLDNMKGFAIMTSARSEDEAQQLMKAYRL